MTNLIQRILGSDRVSEELTAPAADPTQPSGLVGPRFSELQRRRKQTGHDRLPPGQRLIQQWPVLTYGGTPMIDPKDWNLQVWGAVANERIFDYQQFTEIGLTETFNDIHCVTHWSRYDNTWQGVLLADLFDQFEIDDNADTVMFHCYGGYTSNVLLSDIRADDHAMLAVAHDGKPLDSMHGGPVRVVIPSLYFWKSAKWVGGVEFLTRNQPGFWEMYGYHMHGDPWREERYG